MKRSPKTDPCGIPDVEELIFESFKKQQIVEKKFDSNEVLITPIHVDIFSILTESSRSLSSSLLVAYFSQPIPRYELSVTNQHLFVV